MLGGVGPELHITYVPGVTVVGAALARHPGLVGHHDLRRLGAHASRPTYSGFENGDNADSLTTTPTCTTTASATKPVGNYASSCSGASDSNYTITYVTGSVSIGPAPLTITASSGTMTYGGSPRPSRPASAGS